MERYYHRPLGWKPEFEEVVTLAASQYEIYINQTKMLHVEGMAVRHHNGTIGQNPRVAIQQAAWKNVFTFSNRFGFNPLFENKVSKNRGWRQRNLGGQNTKRYLVDRLERIETMAFVRMWSTVGVYEQYFFWTLLKVEENEVSLTAKHTYHFDESASEKADLFYRKYCRHSQGEKAGENFVLTDWQKKTL